MRNPDKTSKTKKMFYLITYLVTQDMINVHQSSNFIQKLIRQAYLIILSYLKQYNSEFVENYFFLLFCVVKILKVLVGVIMLRYHFQYHLRIFHVSNFYIFVISISKFLQFLIFFTNVRSLIFTIFSSDFFFQNNLLHYFFLLVDIDQSVILT